MAKARIKQSAPLGAADTPSETIVKAAIKTEAAVTKSGRHIEVRKLGPLQRLRMAEVLGPLSSNQQFMGIAGVAYCVSKIDGEPIPFPSSKLQLEALVERLGDEGLEAASEAIAKMLGIKVDDEGNLTMDGEVVMKAKNLQPT